MPRSEAQKSKEDVTFAQLRMFVHVARAGSFAQAADELYITQAAVSYQIKTLEDRLSRQLFRRHRGAKATLTTDGDDVLETAIRLLEGAETLFLSGSQSANSIKVRVATGAFLIEECLRPIIPQIHKQFPNVEIEVINNHSPLEAMRGIVQENLDIAIYSVPFEEDLPDYPHLSWPVPMTLVARPGTGQKLASGEISINDFQFIFATNRDHSARWAKQCLRAAGIISVQPPMFSEFVDVVGQVAEDGSGIGYCAVHHVTRKIGDGSLEALDVDLPPMRRVMIRSPEAPDVVLKIEELICKILGEPIRALPRGLANRSNSVTDDGAPA